MDSLRIPIAAIQIVLLLGGCASTKDPVQQLDQAEGLFITKGQIGSAEKLIIEALATYQRQDNPHGLANAYRTYGDFLSSPVVTRSETLIRKDGFSDKSITYDNRLARMAHYYSRALTYYNIAEERYLRSARFDALTNIYYNMAWTHLGLKQQKEACSAFDKTIEAFNENMRRNPSARPFAPAGAASIPAAVNREKGLAGCTQTV
jgi:tetratricopeptide (TPR) repeat protein